MEEFVLVRRLLLGVVVLFFTTMTIYSLWFSTQTEVYSVETNNQTIIVFEEDNFHS